MFVEAKFFHKAGEGSGGGSDPHNLGYYADLTALQTAYPTGTDGDFAILGSTDTIWVWDSGTSAWKDTDTKGQVTSVNGQTGAVTVQETLVSGSNIKSVNNNSLLGSGNLELSTYLTYPAGWTTTGTTKALCDDIAADTSATKGKAYLGEVTCSDLPASMANGEVVVEIMDGTTAANKVIVLTLTSGNTAPYMWKYTYWNGGTDVSGWQAWATSAQGAKADTAVQPGDLATVATTGAYSDLIGTPTIPAAIQVSTMPTAAVGELDKIYQFIGTTDASYTNGYFYKCVSDGQTPATYSWENIGVQDALVNTGTGLDGFVVGGTPRGNAYITSVGIGAYAQAQGVVVIGHNSSTNGYGEYSVVVGKEAISNGPKSVSIGYKTKASSTDTIGIGREAEAKYSNSTAIGKLAKTKSSQCLAVGSDSEAGTGSEYAGGNAVAIGYYAKATAAGAIQLGNGTNNTTGTLQVGLNTGGVYGTTNQYVLLNSDGTIPTDRFTTTPIADGTYVPTLTISSGVATRTWGAAASAPVVPATMPTLAVADWSSNTQTVNVTGVTASNIVFVSPAPASAADYAAAGIVCTAQGSGTLTFTCTTVPSNAITVNVVILG